MTISTAMNGFGRFGLHLLKYWLDRSPNAAFRIDHINDDALTLDQAYSIVTTDPYVRFDQYRVEKTKTGLSIRGRDGKTYDIHYSTKAQHEIPWIGRPRVVLECSGKSTEAARARSYLKGDTSNVLISATSWDADATLVYGFNHESFSVEKHHIVSYGSCTVNAYVPLANFLHKQFGVINSDVNVVHNVQHYRLHEHQTLQRKFCTLERSGPKLLPFIREGENFIVIYSIVPYSGVSMIDFRFTFKNSPTSEALINTLESAFSEGELRGLYGMDEADVGPEAHVCTPYSTVFIKQGIKVLADHVYLQGYFDTENSVNRYFDLANYVGCAMDPSASCRA